MSRWSLLALALPVTLALTSLHAQDTSRRGRKYKAAPETSHIVVEVIKNSTGKPILNAAVIFHAVKDGKDEGNLEVKTNDDGKATIDIIATGSTVDVQVIADGLATFAQQYMVVEADRQIQVRMVSPRAQVSSYYDSGNKASDRSAGVQEPNHPSSAPVVQQPLPTNHTSDPDPITPVPNNETPGNTQNRTPR